MVVDIFIRSYRGDFPWLAHSLQSIKRHAKGFGRVHLAIPSGDITALPAGSEDVHLVNAWEDDYLGQQNDKLHSDNYCQAPYIMVMDSDCILTHELRPEDLFINGKPVWLYEHLLVGASPWGPIVEEALGWHPEFEFMRRHPFVFPRQALVDFRQFMLEKHGEEFHMWLKKRPYRRFSEFNTFGAWAYRHGYDLFEWRQPSEFPTWIKQFWSWGGITKEIEGEIEGILSE